MKINQIALLLFLSIFFSFTVFAEKNLFQEHKDFDLKVKEMFKEHRLPELDQMAEKFRNNRHKRYDGYSYITWFYDSLNTYKDLDQHINKLNTWAKIRKDSSAAHVALARAYIKKAWNSRGRKYASKTSDEAFDGFRKYLRDAKKHLEIAEEKAPNDPHMLALKIKVTDLLPSEHPRSELDLSALSLLRPGELEKKIEEFNNQPDPEEEELKAIYEKIQEIDPGNLDAYYMNAHYNLPQWKGEGQYARFAEMAVEQTKSVYDNALYIYLAINQLAQKDKLFTGLGLEKEKIKLYLKDYEKHFPQYWYKNTALGMLAARMNDRDLAAKYFKEISDDDKGIKYFFGRQKTFDIWKKWALEGGPAVGQSDLIKSVRDHDQIRFTELIKSGAELDHIDDEGQTALLYAAWSEFTEFALALIEAGADPNICNYANTCPINYLSYGDKEVLEALLARKEVNINTVADRSNANPPINSAIYAKKTENALMFLDYPGIDLTLKSKNGATPIQAAVYQGDQQVIDKILEHDDIEINACGGEGCWSPLHIAAWRGQVDLVKKLLAKGAKPGFTTEDGRNSFDIAKQNNQKAVLKVLEAHS